ncbi:MAG: M60 family metallopeptidase [Bacteroidaceae bacterium]|nr:M60 family metallopeptidase [Bacteroidaceae bacterium]
MKRRSTLMTCLFLLLGIASLHAAYTTPQSGKVYRIHNGKSDKVIGEDGIARELVSVDAAANDFKQLWLLQESGSGYLVQNAYSGQYLQPCAQQSTQIYPTSTEQTPMYIKLVSGTGYSIGQAQNAYLHLDNGNNIVRWWDASNAASQWHFEEVTISAEAMSLQQAAFQAFYEEYQAKLELINHIDEYNTLLPTFFTDLTCTELQSTYATMSDEALRTAMSALPATLQEMAVKIKNQAWGHREAEFRIRDYKAYADADYWGEKLYTKKYSRINNPTGVYGNAGDVLYIFVGNDIPQGAKLEAEVISGTSIQGEVKALKKGLNMVPVKKDFSNLFIQYVGTTSLDSETLITDYPALKIHVEQGVVNGYWDKAQHTDADWIDMKTNLFTGDVVQVKGDRIMFHMSRKYITECCATTITDAIGWWDDMYRWQQDMLGIEDVFPSKFNNLGCAISLTTGYQSATHYRTQYAETYIKNLLPYESMMSNADNCWGPAHENGHVHQAAIQSVGTSEVTNNFFSNLTLYKLGRYTSRGSGNNTIFTDYGKHTPYILRDGATTMRLFWQLYLYFHEVKGDTTFYPRVFKAMRATPLKARDPQYYANYVNGDEDLLLFAKVCCDVAQMDLSEFFRFWGYLELTDKQHIGDYGDFYLTTRESDVQEFLAHAAQYPKAPSIIFIEDRVKAEARTDGGKGNKLHHGNAVRVGEAGNVGHYTDFMDTSVEASGYLYNKSGAKITLSEGSGAVGFKVYAKDDNTLLYGSNNYTFTLPDEVASQDIIIVAAQADGTDVVVPSAAEGGNEEQQYAALKSAIAEAKAVIALSDATGMKPGYYFGSVVETLSALLGEANAAYTNKDQSAHTYGEWAVLLNGELQRIASLTNAKQEIYAANWYSITNAQHTSYSIATSGTKLRCTIADAAGSQAKQWAFEPAGQPNFFYILNKETGKYVTTIGTSAQVTATATTTSDALPFEITDNGNGTFLIADPTQSHGAMHCDASKAVVGWDSKATASYWTLTTIVDGQTELFEAQLEKLITRAENILSELIADYNTSIDDATPINIQVDVTPLVGADTLLAWATELQGYVFDYYHADNIIDNYQSLISAVSALIEQLAASYEKPLYLPETSTREKRVLYYIYSVDKAQYLAYDQTSPRYLKYLRTYDFEPTYAIEDEGEAAYLWYFLPTETEGQYYIGNLKSGREVHAVSGKTNIAVDLGSNALPELYTLALNAEQSGFAITGTEGSAWLPNASGYVQMSTKSSGTWLFVKAGTMTDIPPITVPTSSQLYDLMGRPVSMPTPGIYILDGKKMIIR